MELGPALEAAIRAAREAGDLLRGDFHRPGGPRGAVDKADADLEAEERIRGRLRDAFPGWSYLGEETGRASGHPGSPLWLVDPNDGTRDYLKGRRGSAVSIGLLHEGRPVLGVVFAFGYPDDAGDLFVWAEGCGPLRRNGRPGEPRLPQRLQPEDVVLVSAKGDRDPEGNLRCADPARYRAVPSIAHRLALVAAGEASAAVSLFAPGAWDYAAGQALLRAAGGVLLDQDGREVSYAADGGSRCTRAFGGSRAVAESLARQPWDAVGKRALGAHGAWPFRRSAILASSHAPRGASSARSRGTASARAWSSRGPTRWRGRIRTARAGCRTGASGGSSPASPPTTRRWRSPSPVPSWITEATTRRRRFGPIANGRLRSLSTWATRCGPPSRVVPTRPARPTDRSCARVPSLARSDSQLTHPNPVCGDAVAAYVAAIRHALLHGDGPEAAFRAALEAATTTGAVPSVIEALRQAEDDPPVCDGESPGFVLIALRNAFNELLRAESLEAGVVATVRRGGDTDTNAAVAGALLGAVHGRAAVPPQWRSMVLSCRPYAPWAKRPRAMTYWPVDVLDLAERLLVQGARMLAADRSTP